VVLLRSPVDLTIQRVAELLTEAASTPIKAMDIDAPDEPGDENKPAGNIVMGKPPHFVAFINDVTFVMHSIQGKYRQERELHPDLRLRRAIGLHEAWLSVDILNPHEATKQNYRIAARVAAHFAGPECVAVYSPALNQLVARTDDIQARLRDDDPIA